MKQKTLATNISLQSDNLRLHRRQLRGDTIPVLLIACPQATND